MKVSIQYAMFGISAILLPSVDCTVSSYTQELCTTGYGTKSVASVPSTTHALSLEFYPLILSTLTPVATVTPAATTVNATVFTTSTLIESVVTDTYSSTSTETDVTTVQVTPSITVTNTITTTTTLPTPTSTVPTSSGWVPAVSATATFAANARRDLDNPHQPRAVKPFPTKSCHYNAKSHTISNYPASYPSAVTCNELVEVFSTYTSVKTGTKTATQTASTPIVTSTATDTITATSYPIDASTTLTFSTTITVPTTNVNPAVTSTVSTTLTVSYTPPQATYYAACDPSINQVSSYDGYGIDNYAYSSGTINLYGNGSTDPYDCCVACITDPNCGASVDADGLCELFYPSATCAGPNTFAGYYLGGETQNVPAGQGLVVSDGNCGQASGYGTD
ncbi:MAG: hypothetical protein ASARMPREDX12_001780 [Alectoria sarmentosa]|nr:MAG: hypothetical protein ASARMPREDX12_001780 [Alectoria sarmentosa]